MKKAILNIGAGCLLTICSIPSASAQKPSNANTALIVIDIQNDYFPGGKMTLVNANEASNNAKKLIEKSRKAGIPVIHVQHIALQEGATFFLPDTKGAELHKDVTPLKNEKLIVKHYPNSFRETDLLEYLKSKNIKNLVFAGMMTHVCIDATVKAAKDYGFNCEVIADATATRDLEANGQKVKAEEVQNALIAALNFYYAEISSTEKFLRQN
ncbi:nicotinamidase-related amidase [Pedobacter cryoconitis]|uniref:Nicotinamidase-related amidase n=1 Tax=Pedobacter cryoconitis TaxID=188932 RepID=A0A7W8ZNA1_9SPHI|nr:cysteine hydrolase family protein [Pedobacter cryoconitis]MBB5637173.1 nicotinamidase-related amidase [Pedobacter cryoconitis]MBB6273940.1 nicotinamidase-related amidase [Pedobacter cryoconitis]